MSTLIDLPIAELIKKIRKKEILSVDLITEAYDRIEATEPSTNAFITIVDRDTALENATAIDARSDLASLKLPGIPYVMKDAYLTRGVRTTAASKILDDFVPPYSATVHKRLKDAGAILIGKMNMDAWGHGASTENTDYGPAMNPWDLTRSAGGSGGGPAAAIAMRYASFGIGEDTGGSIRNPAAWNNITAMKVTYGRVSRYGAIAYASSLDTMGPTAKTSEDCALVLEVIAGHDPYDATSSAEPVPQYFDALGSSIKGKKIAVPTEFFTGLDPQIDALIRAARITLESLGAIVTDVSLPMLEYGVPMYYILAPSETSSNLSRYDGIRFGSGRDLFTNESKRRIMTGTYALSSGYYDAYYKKAQRARTLLRDAYTKTLTEFDAILSPVTPMMPTKPGVLLDDPVRNMMADLYTGLINIIGLPSLAIPCGFTKDNLPVGMQLIGGMFSESKLFAIGHAYQQATSWHTNKPPTLKE